MTTIVPFPRRHPDGDSWVDRAFIAERWDVHPDTVASIPARELPYMKLGPYKQSPVRYRMADILVYEQRRTVSG